MRERESGIGNRESGIGNRESDPVSDSGLLPARRTNRVPDTTGVPTSLWVARRNGDSGLGTRTQELGTRN